MYDMIANMFCFITVTMSFLYGTRVCWVCGKDCGFDINTEEKKQIIMSRVPAGLAIYAFGFAVFFGNLIDGAFPILVLSITSALVLSQFIVSMAMPALKRRPLNNPVE